MTRKYKYVRKFADLPLDYTHLVGDEDEIETRDVMKALGAPGAKESLSISYNARTGVYSWKAKVRKTNLNDPDAGNVSTAMTIGDNGFLNTQAWKTKGKKLVTP